MKLTPFNIIETLIILAIVWLQFKIVHHTKYSTKETFLQDQWSLSYKQMAICKLSVNSRL